MFLDVGCPNRRCKRHGLKRQGNIVGHGTYRTKSGARARLFLCRACGRASSSRTGTAFFNCRSPQATVLLALRLLTEGLGLRGVGRVMQVKLDTVRGWLTAAARHSVQVSRLLLRDLQFSQVQVDELWTFVF